MTRRRERRVRIAMNLIERHRRVKRWILAPSDGDALNNARRIRNPKGRWNKRPERELNATELAWRTERARAAMITITPGTPVVLHPPIEVRP